MAVVLVDLRVSELRASLRDGKPEDIQRPLDQLIANGSGGTESGALRLLILLPINAALSDDAERLALALLGVDPQPQAIVIAVNEAPGNHVGSERRDVDRVLPNEFGRHPGVRFVDLRAATLSMGHPRKPVDRLQSERSGAWVSEFLSDLLAQLQDDQIFDAVWDSVPQDRVANIGMRIASLGGGRDLAVADLALRLADELQPNREPDMGKRLPDRWSVDSGLLPDSGRAVVARNEMPPPPRPIQGLADVARKGVISSLRRAPNVYNDVVGQAASLLEQRPLALADLFERAEGRRDEPGGPWIDPVGAAELDAALGGIFGDPVARAAEEESDAATLVGDLLEDAAARQADGLSAALLATWLRTDAERVQPIGPAAVAARLREGQRPWAALHDSIDQPGTPSTPGFRGWVGGAMNHQLSKPPGAEKNAPRKDKGSSADADPAPTATKTGRRRKKLVDAAGAPEGSTAPITPEAPHRAVPNAERTHPESARRAWEIPKPLGFVLGSPIWRNGVIRTLYLMIATLFLVAAVAESLSDATGFYIVSSADLGLDAQTAEQLQALITVLAVVMLGYLAISLVVGAAVRRWATDFRFAEVPVVLRELESEARALAISEVARCPARRDFARVARAAADTLEMATAEGSRVARQLGVAVQAEAARRPMDRSTPPYRQIVGSDAVLAGTDAGGIYRIYPQYVTTLRASFAASLVDAVRERWPRIRGVFWKETSSMIAEMAAASLETRLRSVQLRGIQRGDLLRDGVDPADELAERLWADPAIREAALRSLSFQPDDPMPMLASPADTRLLDGTVDGALILAIPATLEPLIRHRATAPGSRVVVTDALETATAFRVFPFKEGLYDLVDFSQTREASSR